MRDHTPNVCELCTRVSGVPKQGAYAPLSWKTRKFFLHNLWIIYAKYGKKLKHKVSEIVKETRRICYLQM